MEEYQGVWSRDYRLHEPYKTVIATSIHPAELLNTWKNEVLEASYAELKVKAASRNCSPKQNSPLIQHHCIAVGFVALRCNCIELLKLHGQQGFSSSSWIKSKGIYYQAQRVLMSEQ